MTHTVSRPATQSTAVESSVAPVLICGATGMLGQAFVHACVARGIGHVVTERDMLDPERPDGFAAVLNAVRPWAVVDAAGWAHVDDAEEDDVACRRVAAGAIALARACSAGGVRYLGLSSDMVFDGKLARAYVESDTPSPLNALGRNQATMEEACILLPGALLIRTAALFAVNDSDGFPSAVLDALGQGRPFAAAGDQEVTPTFVPALVDAALDLLIDGAEGIRHLAGDVTVSPAEFARRIARACGYDVGMVDPVPGASLGHQAPRPHRVALASEHGRPAGSLDTAIGDVARHVGHRPPLFNAA